MVEGAGKPPRDQEEFASSLLGLALAMCLPKAWCFFPSPLNTRLTPAGPGLSGQTAAWTQRVWPCLGSEVKASSSAQGPSTSWQGSAQARTLGAMGQRRASARQTTRREADRQTERALGTMSRPQCKPSKSIKARMDRPPPTSPPRCYQGFKVGPSIVPVCPCSPSPEPHVGLPQRDLFLTAPHLRLCAQGPKVTRRGQPEWQGRQPGKQALLTQDHPSSGRVTRQ